MVLVIVAVGAAVAVSELLMPGLVERARDLVATSPDEAPTEGLNGQRSVTLVTVDDRSGEHAANVAVLSYDEAADQGTVVLVPVGTVAEVPGHGTFTIGEAHDFGGPPLVWVTVDNLLGAQLDSVVALTHAGWASVLSEVGGVDVDVRSRLEPADGRGAAFDPGIQRLEGAPGADYVLLQAEGESEVERLPRMRQVIDGLLAAVADDPQVLDRIITAGSTGLETPDPDFARSLIEDLADAFARERLTTLTLPVSPLGSGSEDLYRVDADRVELLAQERFAASRPHASEGAGTRLQILNGVGVPGIGQEVAERLRFGGLRVVLTGNADHFDHRTTLIVVYDDTPEQVAVAREIQDLLGVGRVERSTTPQTVVDVTIVVGADFARS